MGNRLSRGKTTSLTRVAASTLIAPPPPPGGRTQTSTGPFRFTQNAALNWYATRTRRCWRFPVDLTAEDIDWAWSANVLFWDDDRVLDPAGRSLWSADGVPHPEASYPAPVDARRRMIASETALRNRGIDPLPAPPTAGVGEVAVRAADEIARRALALFLVAVRGESVVADHPIDPAVMLVRSPLGAATLTTAEAALFDKSINADTAGEAVWRYESLATLLWATGWLRTSGWPDQRVEVADVIARMVGDKDEDFIRQSVVIDPVQLLDQLDLTYRLWRWSMGQPQAPTAIDPGVVAERLIALTWMVDGSMRWDAIDAVVTRGEEPGLTGVWI